MACVLLPAAANRPYKLRSRPQQDEIQRFLHHSEHSAYILQHNPGILRINHFRLKHETLLPSAINTGVSPNGSVHNILLCYKGKNKKVEDNILLLTASKK